jgi:transcriptional regulator with XRE-family HTH domain
VRAFAEHLGVAARTVSKWEAGVGATVPRPDTQAILDTALGRADSKTQQRFELLCRPTTAAPVDAQLLHELGTPA